MIKHMLWRWLPCCAVTIACATRASAESWPSRQAPAPQAASTPPVVPKGAGYREHPIHFELIFGADTRVGELGASFEYALGDPLSVGAGVGTNGFGPEWAAHARLRPVWSRTPNGSFFQALTLEGSVSTATLGSNAIVVGNVCDCPETSVASQTVYWAQGELGWEGMIRDGFTFRASSGFAEALGSRRWQCKSGDVNQCTLPPRQLYVQTFALGVAF